VPLGNIDQIKRTGRGTARKIRVISKRKEDNGYFNIKAEDTGNPRDREPNIQSCPQKSQSLNKETVETIADDTSQAGTDF